MSLGDLQTPQESGQYLTQEDLAKRMITSVLNGESSEQSDLTDQNNEGGSAMIRRALGLSTTESEEDESEDQEDAEEEENEEDEEVLEDEESDEESDDESDEDESEDETDDEESEDEGDFKNTYLYKNEDGRKVFLEATDPETGEHSVYLTRETAQDGLQKQLKLIGQLKTELTTAQSESEAQLNKAEEELTFYRSALNKEALRAMMILQRMPEDLRNLDPDKILDQNKRLEYERAAVKAEAQLEHDVETATQKAKDQKNAKDERRRSAKTFVKGLLNDKDFLGNINAENKHALQTKLAEKTKGPGGVEYTFQQKAELISEEFGEDDAKRFLNSVVAEFRTNQQKKVAKDVEKIGPKIKTKRRKTAGDVTKSTKNNSRRSAKDMIRSSLGANSQRSKSFSR